MLLRNFSICLTVLALACTFAGPYTGTPVPAPQFDPDACTDFEACIDGAEDKYWDMIDDCNDLYDKAAKICKGKKSKKAKAVCYAAAEYARACCYAAADYWLLLRINGCCDYYLDELGGGDCWSYNINCG